MKFVLLLLLSIALVAAQDDRVTDPLNKFKNPPPAGPKLATDPTVYYTNPSYVLGYSIPFEWTTNVSEIDLILVKEGADSNSWVLGSALTSELLYWNGTTPSKEDLDLKPRDTFWLGAWDANESGGTPVFFSHYFNFTVDTSTTTKSSTSSSATRASSSTISEASATASTTPSSTGLNLPVVSEVPDEKKSNSTAIGAGVGGGVGGAIVILGLVGFFLYRRRQKKAQLDHQNGMQYNGMQHNGMQPAPFSPQAPPYEPPKELYSGFPTQQQPYNGSSKPDGRAQLP